MDLKTLSSATLAGGSTQFCKSFILRRFSRRMASLRAGVTQQCISKTQCPASLAGPLGSLVLSGLRVTGREGGEEEWYIFNILFTILISYSTLQIDLPMLYSKKQREISFFFFKYSLYRQNIVSLSQKTFDIHSGFYIP